MNQDLSTGLQLFLVTLIGVAGLVGVYLAPSIKVWIKAHTDNADLQKIVFWANTVVEEARATGLITWGQKFSQTLLDDLTTKLDANLLNHGISLDLHSLESLILKEIGNPQGVNISGSPAVAMPATPVVVPTQPPPPDPSAVG